jgi:CheY-like chemotaxis protein
MATDFALVNDSMQTQETISLGNTCSQRRILLVDDAAGATQLTARLLGMLGHQVSLAHDGQSAIATALHTLPHVIMLDLQLPDMNGCDVVRELKRHAELAASLFVAVTGFSDSETRSEATAAGFDEFIVKPAAMDSLEQLLLHPKLPVITG